jgi:bacteriocin-like protein
MKNLENFGVQELNAKELEEVSGGFLGLLLGVVFVTGLLWGLIDGKDK